MSRTPQVEAAPDANSLVCKLIALRADGKLWMAGYEPEHECDKKPLSDEGKAIVKALVQMCLEHGIAPNCCVSGADLTCDVDGIISLGPAEYEDLLEKVMRFTAPILVTS